MSGNPPSATDLLDDDFASLVSSPLLTDIDVDILPSVRVPLPGLGSTELVERTDLTLPGPVEVPVRIHRPRRPARPAPGILSIHGGGFVVGSYDMDDVQFEAWCPELGVVGVSVQYRLSPETPYPGALEDCYHALQWVHQHAPELGVDRARLGICGASAGGGLAAALALLARDLDEIPLAFQILAAPMLDDRLLTPSSQLTDLPIWSRQANAFGWRCYLGELERSGTEVPAYAAPARATDLTHLPPSLVSVGSVDGFRDEDVDYATRLNQAGVPTELHVYAGAPHGYQMFVDSDAARRSARDTAEWLAHVTAPLP